MFAGRRKIVKEQGKQPDSFEDSVAQVTGDAGNAWRALACWPS